jgi:hypothetical protein
MAGTGCRPCWAPRWGPALLEGFPINMPCGHTLASVCPPCAERKRKLRATQCREGRHLESEPVIVRADPDDEQRFWVEKRAEVQHQTEQSEAAGEDASEPASRSSSTQPPRPPKSRSGPVTRRDPPPRLRPLPRRTRRTMVRPNRRRVIGQPQSPGDYAGGCRFPA